MAYKNEVRGSDDWGSCEAGELSGLSRRLRAEQARKTQSRVAGGVLAAAMAVLAIAFLPGGGVPSQSGWDLSCTRCVELMPAFRQHSDGLATLSAEEAELVGMHLEVCPKCRDHYKANFPAAAPAGEAIGWLENVWLLPASRG